MRFRVIFSVASALVHGGSCIQLVEGVFGAGKSYLIAVLIMALNYLQTMDCFETRVNVLLCALTNGNPLITLSLNSGCGSSAQGVFF